MQNKLIYVEPKTIVVEVQGESMVCASGPFGAPYYEEEDA